MCISSDTPLLCMVILHMFTCYCSVVVVCSRVILELSEVCFCKLYSHCIRAVLSFEWVSITIGASFHSQIKNLILTSEFHYSSLSFIETKMPQGARPAQCGGCRTTVMTYRPEISVQTKKAQCVRVLSWQKHQCPVCHFSPICSTGMWHYISK
jgi:hypothetical protein